MNRKPYFMRYVYPDTMRDWKEFVRKAQDNCLRFFRMTFEQLQEYADQGKATQEQLNFLVNYEKYMPVSDGNCVVNRICHYIEDEFETLDEHISDFNPAILKGGQEATESQKKQIAQLYKDYTGDMRHVMDECKRQHVDNDERKRRRMAVKEYYMEQCGNVCSNLEQLCNAMVDVCYKANTSKAFVWDVCGEQLVKNVLSHGDGCLHYPMRDDNGIILYKGHRYTMKTVEVNNNDNTGREDLCRESDSDR